MKIIDNDPERIGKWVAEKTNGTFSPQTGTAIGLERDGEIIAGVTYEHYMGGSVSCHIAAEHLTREFLWFVFYYPFEQLKVNKILAIVDDANVKAIKFDEHLGFQLEHIIEGAGSSGSLRIYSMNKMQCKFLGYRYEQRKFAKAA